MSKKRNLSYGLMDIPLSCSVFLEPALNRYVRSIAPLSRETKQFVHEWNLALIDILKSSRYRVHLGDVGYKILSGTVKSSQFPTKCVETARNVPLHSLHYALRFSESIVFLSDKIKQNDKVKFVDFGSGFSPLAPIIQSEYNVSDTYCIDNKPEILEVYSLVSEMVSGRSPICISWDKAKSMAESKQLDTIVAMGLLPYIPLDEQVADLKFINANFPNFLVEIKYNSNPEEAGENVFDLKRLQKLRLSVENTKTIETTMIQNSLRYLHRFMCAMPGKKYFLEKDRSLFLSR